MISKKARQVFQTSRELHIYVSTLFFALLIFFSITGILLNHTSWMASDAREGEREIEVPAALQKEWENAVWDPDAEPVSVVELKKFLRTTYGLEQPKELKFDHEFREITLDYQTPSAYAFVTVRTEEKKILLEFRQFGFWQVMGDLHKGRNSGKAWSWVIDVSALAMIFFSLTGMVILVQNMKYRRIGLVLCVAGLFLPWMIYYFLVPRLTGV
ncbi:PepSY-associated TM helix domain-containing protein [Oligoflexus tunisiensis]|uniref:PepSY-associated TM helix domain-containing protein n=1 Tax=Oligoflexus tunisiensis TaxID=708132 RepID=UPI00159EFC44|nr:PepSY-associated TM helix domain-containing protein [Oligoflexus tunisiensis]